MLIFDDIVKQIEINNIATALHEGEFQIVENTLTEDYTLQVDRENHGPGLFIWAKENKAPPLLLNKIIDCSMITATQQIWWSWVHTLCVQCKDTQALLHFMNHPKFASFYSYDESYLNVFYCGLNGENKDVVECIVNKTKENGTFETVIDSCFRFAGICDQELVNANSFKMLINWTVILREHSFTKYIYQGIKFTGEMNNYECISLCQRANLNNKISEDLIGVLKKVMIVTMLLGRGKLLPNDLIRRLNDYF